MQKKKKINKIFNQKVSLQSFFCQTMETKYLLEFATFLRQKYLNILQKEQIHEFKYYYPITDKVVDLPVIYSLSIIPFFDGVYVSSPNRDFNRDLDKFVNEFNKNNSKCIRFIKKEIKERKNHIENVEELACFLIIYRWISDTSNKKNFNFLIQHLNLVDNLFEELSIIEQGSNTDQQWECEYKKLIEELHIKVYTELLEHRFNSEIEINNFIQKLSKEKIE